MRHGLRAGTLLLALLIGGGCLAQARPAAPAAAAAGALYPFEVRAPFDVSLFHWVDSLAGTSGGKTIPLYRGEFAKRFGSPTDEDRAQLRRFYRARGAHASGGNGVTPGTGLAVMLGVFMEETTLDGALDRLAAQMPRGELVALRRSLEHFRPRYHVLWKDASYLARFARAMDEPRTRGAIEGYLAEMAVFFGVSATEPPRPRLVLVPVPGGGGTHAQAVGTNLLLEIRPGDTPLQQISVIAHENAHFLFNRIPPERLARLREAALRAAPDGEEAWRLLHEGLPTALGQGVAESRLQPRAFSRHISWYHLEEVDRFAKRIFPIVERAMEEGRTLDEALVEEMVRVR